MHSSRARSLLLFVFAATGASSVSWATTARAQLTSDEQAALLNAHNMDRSEVALGEVSGQPAAANMTQLTWSTTLAQTAQTWANGCQFMHNPALNGQPIGENLVLGAGGLDDPGMQAAVNVWFSEHTSYTYPTASSNTGHYTQVVWANTTQVGCGAANCSSLGGVYVVCDYSPAGNLNSQPPYVTGTACTQCPSGQPGCSQGLCVPASPSPAVPLQDFAALAVALGAAGAFGLRRRTVC